MFTNKVVLVTGSSRGIGKSIAEGFAKQGAFVILNSRSNISQLKTTYNEFEEKGYKCSYIQADVSDYYAVFEMVDTIISLYGQIDVLVNNAGISHIGLFTDMSLNDWNNIMSTNISSVFNCCRLVIPHMLREKNGCIINISSIWGNDGASCEVAYSASKGAVNSFTKALAKELGPSGIRVNAIACGVIDTQMNSFLSDDEKTELCDEISLMRFGQTSEVADLATYIASENASFLTGQIITLDGGM